MKANAQRNIELLDFNSCTKLLGRTVYNLVQIDAIGIHNRNLAHIAIARYRVLGPDGNQYMAFFYLSLTIYCSNVLIAELYFSHLLNNKMRGCKKEAHRFEENILAVNRKKYTYNYSYKKV